MVKKIIIFSIVVFMFAIGYLYQKTNIIVLAYQIQDLEDEKAELFEKRQKLLCKFYQNTSLDKLNQWAANKDFSFPKENNFVQIAVLESPQQEPRAPKRSRLVLAFVEKVFGIGTNVEAKQDRK